ncbi:MAG: hypothetical protein ABJO02_09790 [Reichenbachiella sp.]|uniref:hypothetical protein n=1 Tax=Reichenbachiella sp. TaxID=2184521 RepID=UPI0032993BE9
MEELRKQNQQLKMKADGKTAVEPAKLEKTAKPAKRPKPMGGKPEKDKDMSDEEMDDSEEMEEK